MRICGTDSIHSMGVYDITERDQTKGHYGYAMPILCNPTKITHHLGITYPIIQAGMVWVSGAKLAAASSEAGCLGVLGAGSLTGELLSQHIHKVQKLTKKPFAVNFPIMYHGTEQQVNLALQMGVKIFIMSAGSPKVYTKRIQQTGAQVWHVTSSPLLAKKCEDAGVDGVIVEGFEAGGHNGRDELTTLVLVPQVKKAVNLPVVLTLTFQI